MHSSRRSSVESIDKSSEVSAAAAASSPKAPSTPSTNGKLQRLASSVGRMGMLTRQASTMASAAPAAPVEEPYTPSEDALALIKSFRRKKYIRTRLLMPLQSNDGPPSAQQRRWTPRKAGTSPRKKAPLSEEQQSITARLSERCERGNNEPNGREEGDEDNEMEDLQRVHALLASQDEINHWIASYETQKAQFTSFALLTEMKLDEIQANYAVQAGRPNAVEAAACCATLLKMPGIVGCYRSLLEKLVMGFESVVYLPLDDSALAPSVKDDQPMTTVVRSFYTRKPYFQRMRELETQLRSARSLTDPSVVKSLTIEELKAFALQVPVRKMATGIVDAYASHLPHLDHLLATIHEKKLKLQLEFYQLHGHHHRRGANRRRSSAVASDSDDDEEDFDGMADDVDYPMTVPLTSSAQICRAISQHATTFSSSGKEMILCSILEHIEIDSFKDVFKRFDAHGKTCFLHHLSVFESSDHLQLILEQLPNPGDTLFRFYYVICGGGGSGRLDERGAGSDPKHVFFHKVLSAEMEFFFLCDLAGYLNDEQWTLLSQEYEKHAQERKNRRKRLRNRRRLANGANGEDDGNGEEDQEGEDDGDGDGEEEFPVQDQKKTVRSSSKASLEHFQLMVWNYLHHHKLTSPQIWGIIQSVLFASLEEPESLACIDHCMERMTISNRWKKLLGLVEHMEPDSGATAKDDGTETEHEIVRHFRSKMLKKLFAMLSREEQATWMDKTTAKYGVLTNKPPPPARKPEVLVVQTPQKPPNLDDPKPWMAQMRLDVKMLWIEALLEALTKDKETSARTAMLKQVLVPFLNGQTPVASAPVLQEKPPPKPEIVVKMTLSEAEKAIYGVVAQLKQQRPGEEVALWQKIIPEHLRPPLPVAKSDRASSPVPELAVPSPAPKPVHWWETATSNSEVAAAFRALLEVKSETEVLSLLQKSAKKRDASENQDADEEENEHQKSASIRDMVKRKVSAVVAVSQPMEWQERVKVGMLDETTQTDFPDVCIIDESPIKPAPVLARPPLTLTALLGRQALPSDKNTTTSVPGSPRRKGDAKFQKLNNAAVPKAIAGLITSWRVNTDQLMQFAKKTMATVLRLIADAYGEMLTAGRRKANFLALSSAAAAAATPSGHRGTIKELSPAQIVYQQFLHSYGLPGIADMHLLAFSCALEAYRAQHLRVEFFSRFVFEEVSKLELTNFLEFLECLVCDDAAQSSTSVSTASSNNNNNNNGNTNALAQGPVMTKRQRFVPRVTVPDKENWMVPLEKAQEAAQLCFRPMRKQAVIAFCDKLALLASQGASTFVPGTSDDTSQLMVATPITTGASAESGRSSPPPFVLAQNTGNQAAASEGLMINADHLLQLVVDEWREEQLRREGHLLNVFRAGDVNGDGELTSAEFTHIVLAIDHTRDLGDIMLMYSDTLRRTQCEAIDANIFLQVAKEYELDRAAWNEDGELRNIVNDINELEETWQHTRTFFLGTLEALARDLPTLHFLRVCEGAGCGCLKCILDGYIGFQRMRRDYYTSTNPRISSLGSNSRHRSTAVSEALLWARFWHLMRQLYEACSESPGIITAWEGADYMRIEAAPRPPPRYVKFRRHALPNFLFPDTARISGMISNTHKQTPEVFDRETILQQFVTLMDLMTFTTSGKNSSSDGGGVASI